MLWTMVLLAFLGTRISASGRAEAQLAANLRAGAVAEAAADAAVYEAVFHLLASGAQRWAPEGRYRVALPQASVDVRVEDLAGRINVNAARPELLAALLGVLGVAPGQAAPLAAAITDWRSPGQRPRPGGAKAPAYLAAGLAYGPPGAPFRDIDELGDVLGMTPALLALLQPHISVWGEGDPDPVRAGPVVRAALEALGVRPPPYGGAEPDTLTVALTAEATGPAAARFVRYAVVQTAPGVPGKPWRMLVWTVGAG